MKTIKTIAFSVFLLAGAAIFSGCPISIKYPLAESGTEKINKELIGTWSSGSQEAEVKKVEIAKMDDYNYKIVVQERGEMYAAETDEFKGWVYTMDGHTFLIAQEYEASGTLKESYYLYKIVLSKKSMTVYDVSLKEGGVDAVTSSETFKAEVKASMKKEDWYTSAREYTKE